MTNLTLDQMVQREVIYGVSILVSELAKKPEYQDGLMPVMVQDDYEEAATEHGWDATKDLVSALNYCAEHDVEPYQNEAYEHWIVTDWLAAKLEAEGEMVLRDFMGMTIWGRATTGQSIALDYVIGKIYAEAMKAA